MDKNHELFANTFDNLSNETDNQIVEKFNANIQNKYFNRFFSFYLSAIHSELYKQGVDYHLIGDSKTSSLKRKVVLDSNVLIPK